MSPVTLGTISPSPGTFAFGAYVGSQKYTISNIELILLSNADNYFGPPDNMGANIEVRSGSGSDYFQIAGNYTIDSGAGNDTFFISPVIGQVTSGIIDGGAGTDLLKTNIGFNVNLATGIATSFTSTYVISGIEDVTVSIYAYAPPSVTGDASANVLSVNTYGDDGSGGVTFFGGGGNDTLNGSAGADILDGGTDADIMAGGKGDDGYVVDDVGDTVTELAGEGIDTVRSSISYSLPANVENLFLTGTADLVGSGNALNNTLTGNSGHDALSGGDGDDAFVMSAYLDASDRIDGGAGNDQVGIQGDYTGANRLVLGATTLTNVEVLAALPGYGYDITTHDATVAAGQVFTMFGGNLGAGQNLTFDGSAETDGAFRVYGGLGTERVTTGAGEDGIYFGPGKYDPASDFVDGGAGGNDQLALDGSYPATLSGNTIKNIEVIALLPGPSGDQNRFMISTDDSLVGAGTGMTIYGAQLSTSLAFDGSFETDGRFTVFGGRGDDTIRGGAGDDMIFGGLGADTLTGGGGRNSYRYEAAAESTATSQDKITDFRTGDVLDLSRMDANIGTQDRDTFRVIGFDAFHQQAGELRFQQVDASTVFVQGDVDGDGVADFSVSVHITGGHAISQADFVL